MKTFEELLGKENPLLKSIKNRGFETPTEIQEKSIPVILEGKDIIAGASTGSGKTLAFASGLIKNVKKDFGIQGLVLTPTRELAEQITKELTDFSKYKKLEVTAVYGGLSIINQIKRLETAEIVVGTPGRVLDHLERNSIDLSGVNTLVIDEADRMFDMGFIDDVEKIIFDCSAKRQTMLFSATISVDVSKLAGKHLKKPVEISAEPHVDPTKLTQVYYDVDDGLKYSLLKHLIENEKSDLIMIFCNTRRNVDFVANNLKAMGIESVPIHGGFAQEKRNRIMEIFHSKKVHVLVATDVAARGLDIKEVSHVYNYDIPPTKDEYIHRIGRTARAGKEGKVINILTSRDYDNFSNIASENFNIKREKTPYIERAEIRWIPERRHGRYQRDSQQSNLKTFNNSRNYGRERFRRSQNTRGQRNSKRFSQSRESRNPRGRFTKQRDNRHSNRNSRRFNRQRF